MIHLRKKTLLCMFAVSLKGGLPYTRAFIVDSLVQGNKAIDIRSFQEPMHLQDATTVIFLGVSSSTTLLKCVT